ncbi:MAG: tail fiber domain-containing protein [Prevotella sp.]|nr:tail fiber domain-containing protein [Prevotella sp.]
MKKTLLILFCTVLSLQTNAQLKVNTSGNVTIASTTAGPAKLNVGSVTGYDGYFLRNVNLYSKVNYLESQLNIGVLGDVNTSNSNSEAVTVGVFGTASNSGANKNFGVIGILGGTTNGAGIYGTTNTSLYSLPNTYGRYAAYFDGATYVTGSQSASSYLTFSDRNLKENIAPLTSDGDEPAIEKVMDMNVVKYNYKKREIEVDENALQSMSEDDKAALELERENAEKEAQKLHFGLIAQELQTIYPNLVTEGQDGMLAINYVELVPVLIQSIKELKQEISEMKGEGQITKAPTATAIESATAEAKSSMLYQNTPNPFNGQTTIRFQIADGAHSAYICIFDMQGKQLQRHDLSTSDDSLTIDGTQLGAGMYLYTLIVDGKEIDTKRMILSK